MIAKAIINEELRINSSLIIQTSQRSETHSTLYIPHSSFINVTYVDIACSISLMRMYSSAL